MGHPDGAHTHGGGGGGHPVAVIAGLAVLAILLPTLIAVVHALLIALAIVAGTAVTAVLGFAVWRVRCWAGHGPYQTPPKAVELWQAAQPAAVPGSAHRPALGAPQQVHQHLHFHGMTAEEIAAILRAPTPKEN